MSDMSGGRRGQGIRPQAMPLRQRAERVQVVMAPDTSRPVIGTVQPESAESGENLRSDTAAHWGTAAGPRQEKPAALVEPRPQREQTILASQLPADARQLLVSGLDDKRQVDAVGLVTQVKLRL